MSAIAKIRVTKKQIMDMLVGAFEGGSNYWYFIDGYNYPSGITYADFCDRRKENGELGKFCNPDEYFHPTEIIPTVADCSLIITDSEGDGKKYVLDLEALERGVQVMAEKYPRHFSDWMGENDDADTADVFLQCCLFGEVIYG